MKTASTSKPPTFSALFIITLAILSCKGSPEQRRQLPQQTQSNKSVKIVDPTEDLPLGKPDTTFLDYATIMNGRIWIGVVRQETKNDLNYAFYIGREKFPFKSQQIPIGRDVQDFTPYVVDRLDAEVEKHFYKKPPNCFVISFEYGNGHVGWNYLYQIDVEENSVRLKDLFNLLPSPWQIHSDTTMQITRYRIDTDVKQVRPSMIDSIFQSLYEKNTETKWVVRRDK